MEKIQHFIVELGNISKPNGTLVIMSSNVGGQVINQHVLKVMKAQIANRELLTHSDLVDILRLYGQKAPWKKSTTAKSNTEKYEPWQPSLKKCHAYFRVAI